MKLKQINRTAIQSWSPSEHHPIYLATGTSAQQLDSSFSTTASLEFFHLDLSDSSLDMKSCGSFSSPHRYHKLVWGPYGMDGGGNPSGVLIAGGENGNVILYDPAKILEGRSDVVIAESDRHSGPVRALDVNPFQMNLVASGGNESEIYIWDMNNFGSPMTPGPKTQPAEDISCVSWNRQVQHILASASPSGRASVWDLRKNDLIIKVSDHSNRMRCSSLAWNPEVATQLVVASEDDRMPVIQMWDLRFATSPLKILEHHTRGVLSIAWSLADPELLLSCGKDNRILCWNPGTAEVLYELPTSSQWCFDIQWCPRNPAVLSAAGFDGHIDVYSIMGSSSQAQSQRHADQISTSFGNMDPFGTGQALPPLQLPQTSAPPAAVTPLKKPPKWIRRPVGASFAFGGKLVSLENSAPDPQQPAARLVHVSQVVTETAFLRRSHQLQQTMSSGGFVDFCQEKIQSAENPFEKTVWSFLKANFESDIRSKYLGLLGYNKEELALKITAALEGKPAEPPKVEVLTSATAALAAAAPPPLPDLSVLPPTDTPEAAFDLIAASNSQVAATLDLNSTSEVEAEDLTAAEEPEPEDLAVASEADVHVEQVLPEDEEEEEEVPLEEEEEEEQQQQQEEEEEEEEEVPLEEETVPPAEAEPNPSEAPADTLALFEAPPPADASALFEAPPPADASALFEAPPPADASALFEAPPPANASALFEAPPPADASALFEAPPPADASALFEAPPPVDASALFEITAPDGDSAPFEVAAPGLEVPTPIEVPPPVSTPAGGVSLSISQDVDGLITQALLTGDFEGAVELCLHDNRLADSIILAIAGGAELLEKTQKKYFTKTHSKITKLISAVVMKDWHDILKTCDLHNWKEALAAVMTYAQPEEFSFLCDLLGGRLEASADHRLQTQACLCYVCAGNVEKLVFCWSRSQDGHSPLSLQDLVEKVVVLRRAVELTQRSGPAAIGVLLAEKMSRYANLLASQGSLSTAIAYLPNNTDQVSVQQLRERLGRALGQHPAGPLQTPQGPQHTFTPIQPPAISQPRAAAPMVAPTPVSAPPRPQYCQPVRAASTVTSWSNQTPTALPHVHPPPPLSSSEQQVENSNSLYGMAAPGPAGRPPPASSTPAYMISHQYQPYPQVGHFPPGSGGVPLYQPLQYSSSSSFAPPPAEPSSPPPPGFLSHYTSQPPPLFPGQQPAFSQCPTSPPPSHPPFFYPSSSTSSSTSSSFPAPPSSGASFQHGGPGSPVSYLPPPPAPGGVSGPQNGWNDPPALTRAPKKKVVQNYAPLPPIMAPLGLDPQQQAAPPGGQGPHGGQVPYSGLQQQPLAPPPLNPAAAPTSSAEGPPGAPTGDLIQPLQNVPAHKVTKKPIPEEHLVLKTTFEALIQRCLAVASDPQTKRKLDDASKRLEVLYDKLREQTLSPAIVGGLHNMARSVEARRYTDGLNIHTHIVGSSNFSETSAFMPVLKVVLTQANKLGV